MVIRVYFDVVSTSNIPITLSKSRKVFTLNRDQLKRSDKVKIDVNLCPLSTVTIWFPIGTFAFE